MTAPRCRLCKTGASIHQVLSEGALYRCPGCGFVFSAENGHDPLSLFTRSYAGDEHAAGMSDFFLRIKLRADADSAGIDPSRLMNSAQQEVAGLVRRRVPKGTQVLDIGCGLGYFLRAMSASGYVPFGLDVAEPVVRLLRLEGFQVWNGTIETVPDGWVDPEICTAFFVLHHTGDPVAFLRTIRTKFPRARLIVAAYNDLDHGIPPATVRRLPPRTYSWWGSAHLRLALEAAGYQAKVWHVKRRAADGGLPVSMGLYRWLGRRSATAPGRFLRSYYDTLPFWGWAPVLWDRWIRRFSDPLLGIGTPLNLDDGRL